MGVVSPCTHHFNSIIQVQGDVPNINEIRIEFNAPPSDGTNVVFTIRHSGATLVHNIILIELEIDGETIQLTPLPPSEQVGNTIIEYNFTIQQTQFSSARARARCSVHGWSSWTQLNNRIYNLIVELIEGSGSTNPTPATYIYEETVEIPVTAIPEQGWSLSHWVLDGVDIGAENPYTINMDRGHRIKAVFIEFTAPPPLNYTLSIEAPDGMGTTDPATGEYVYDEDETISITANPDTDWIIDQWIIDGTDSGNETTILVNMDRDHSVKAVFTESPPVNIIAFTVETPEGSGTTDPEPGTIIYYQSLSVTVTATPDEGWVLDHWELNGVSVGDENPITVDIDGDRSLKAVFKQEEIDSGGGIPGYPVLSILIGISLLVIILDKKRANNPYSPY